MVNFQIRYRFKDKSNPQYNEGYWYLYTFCGTNKDEIKQSCLNIQLKNLHRDWKNREFKTTVPEQLIIKDEEAIYNYIN